MSALTRFDTLRRLKRATCRLESDVGVGSGYLVGAREVATCAHVVGSLPEGARIKARFDGMSEVAATLVKSEKATDSALLTLEAPLADVSPLPIRPLPLARTDWMAYGFPAFAQGLGIPLTGFIIDPDAEIPGKLRGLAVFSPMLAGNPPESVGGFSGSPVLAGDVVIGHLSSVLGAGGRMKQPHLGYAFVAPIPGVMSLLGVPAPAPALAPQPPTREEEVVRRSASFHRLQFATSSQELHDIVADAETAGLNSPELRLYAAEMLISFALPAEALTLLEGLTEGRAEELVALAKSLLGQHTDAFARVSQMAFSAEARGIMGGMYKRRWLATRHPMHLRLAFQTYLEAYTALDDHYPGVNAAACALYVGDTPLSQEIAGKVAAQLARKTSRTPWERASYAEALLLTGDLHAAREEYRAAALALGFGTRNLAVMRAQARRNLASLGLPADALGDALPTTRRAAAFTGHRVGEHLSSERIPLVRRRLTELLAEQEVQFGYCSAASGADILFIEAMLEREAEVHVFLPFPAQFFRETSVGPDPSWLSRFDRLIARLPPRRVTILSDTKPEPGDAMPHVRCNEEMQTAARAQAAALGSAPLLVAVIAADAESDQPQAGGTAHALRAWFEHGENEIARIDPRGAFDELAQR